MAIDIGSKTVLGQERSARIIRITPANGAYRVIIEREIIYKDGDGVVVSREDSNPSVDLGLDALVTAPATAIYLAACQAARNVGDLVNAEAAWYDALAVANRTTA